jgi:hypothetical protein
LEQTLQPIVERNQPKERCDAERSQRPKERHRLILVVPVSKIASSLDLQERVEHKRRNRESDETPANDAE